MNSTLLILSLLCLAQTPAPPPVEFRARQDLRPEHFEEPTLSLEPLPTPDPAPAPQDPPADARPCGPMFLIYEVNDRTRWEL